MKIDWLYLNSLAEANVTNMANMFYNSKINSDISIQANEPWRVRKWDVRKVKDMSLMFVFSTFNSDISK